MVEDGRAEHAFAASALAFVVAAAAREADDSLARQPERAGKTVAESQTVMPAEEEWANCAAVLLLACAPMAQEQPASHPLAHLPPWAVVRCRP